VWSADRRRIKAQGKIAAAEFIETTDLRARTLRRRNAVYRLDDRGW
jgi:hypothetical protein